MNIKLISAATVRQLCGGISDMALWRRLNRPDLNFPRPRYVGKRRYWVEHEVIDWVKALPLVQA
jgi:predicted DNA-binding transcriptional regulator AlpA